MKRLMIAIMALLLGTFGNPRPCPAPVPTSRPASADAPEEQIADLSRTVLADPLDTSAMARLAELRRLERQNRRAAFEALIQALQNCLEGNRAAAHMAALKVRQVPEVEKLAESVLGIPLHELVSARRDPEQPRLCRSCGDTGRADCNHCRGSGVVSCSLCRGRGTLRNRDPVRVPSARALIPCPDCNAVGAAFCPHCEGRGTASCRTCTGNLEHQAAEALFDEPMLGRIRRLAALARYLRDGGVDLFSRHALTCSPQMDR